MRINPNKQPCTPMQAEQMADEAFHTAIACTMSTVAETGRFTVEQLQGFWKTINYTSDKIARGDWSLPRLVESFERTYNVRVRRLLSGKTDTVGKARKQARAAFSIACAIMVSVIAGDGGFSPEETQELWLRIEYKYDSLRKGYCRLTEMCEALEEEYGITVGGVLIGKN